MTDDKKTNVHMVGLIISLSHAAMYQMGKVANPVTGKMEKDLKQARISIDMLQTLRDKTQGNLSEQEEELMTKTLADLQLNYVDEVGKKEEKSEEKKGAPAQEKEKAPPSKEDTDKKQ